MSKAAGKRTAPIRHAAGWLALGASPSFALMALVAAHDTSALALCASGTSPLPVDGMTAMYSLMCLFHLPPWLRLASARLSPPTEGDRA